MKAYCKELDVHTPSKINYLFFTDNFWVSKSRYKLFKRDIYAYVNETKERRSDFTGSVILTEATTIPELMRARTLHKKGNYLYFLLLYRACNTA